ncbi:dipeptidase PepE [Aliikangiella coralliicola]|uniref:dipeptidase E n=1 Tax=Aliikangiella coralliicola TaxID=2592383 RepID=A0A545UDH7_9GAMM|nr:dipeptidase PepE [Aliikangiella coralliicola]TQV87517.1 dipeptidase PepE [Aliikangiella coralliicola]
MNLLLLSSSRAGNTGYLEHALPMIQQHLNQSDVNNKILFIPYAGISVGFDEYEQLVSKAFALSGLELSSIHQHDDAKTAVREANAIVVGGGNTFCLLNSLYENDLISLIGEKVREGTPYIGWSAGSNIAAPTICTTNDMPIVEPPSFKALSLVTYQINPHYLDGNPPGHNGETRQQRISEYLTVNPNQKVIGLPEGTALAVSSNESILVGDKEGFIFSHDEGKQQIAINSNINDFL